jgi:hypothetical protein
MKRKTPMPTAKHFSDMLDAYNRGLADGWKNGFEFARKNPDSEPPKWVQLKRKARK